ncbi:serine hydrolase [Cohnella sp. AR92]|uniref:serine hydrolase n=1 Tax=Cohnella sp. AR92 TaxID=648716 RepID=UPI000F8EF765|nr:serine hydrolase [Cohnella sp. AR92]RUS48380.1 penicillin-binding protein [Cohnella sp. AR92]
MTFKLIKGLSKIMASAILFSLSLSGPGAYAATPSALSSPTAAASASIAAQANGPSDPLEVASFMDGFFERPEVKASLAGASVAVVKDGKVLLNKGYGYANLALKKPVDPERTVFRLASISKTFTAMAVMQLAEQKKLDLDRDVNDYLKGMKIVNRTGSPLTARDLMTHTSGFDFTDIPEDEGDPSGPSYGLDDFVKDYMPTVIRKPGEAFRYDNYGYNLLGYIVEQASGQKFEDYVAEHIFVPLGMENSRFVYTPDLSDELATPYDVSGQPIAPYTTYPYNSPDGGLMSTGADMARFMLAELNGGRLGDRAVLRESSMQAMERYSVSIHPDIPGVGYGFESSFPAFNNGQYVIDKSGAASGFQSQQWLLPERKTGLFVALNSSKDARLIRSLLYQSFMDHYFPVQDAAAPVYLNPSKSELEELEGIYRDLRLPAWHYDIEAADGALIVTDSYGVHELKQLKDLLFVDDTGRMAAFKRDDRGRIVYFQYNKADSWSERLPDAKLYADVPQDSPYARSILYLRQQGLLEREDQENFRPERPITRAQFVGWLIPTFGVRLSEEPVIFKDSANSPYAAEIQTALEGGVITGTTHGTFEPDRFITREAAAVILSRLLRLGLGATPGEAKLIGQTDSWALEGVRHIVASGYYGPEVVPDADGAYDYHSKRPMLRQEAAAMLYRYP